jgi:hypothetical protein
LQCPDGYSHVLPLISERVHYGIMDPCAGLTPCGPSDFDTNVQLSFSSGPYFTLHADFWNTWHQDVLDRMTQDCMNAHIACSFLGSRYTVSVVQSGSGSGTVTSDPAGVDCGSTCAVPFPTSTHITLTAAPAEGSTFTGWAGACTGTDPCTVTAYRARSVTATFDSGEGQTYTLSVGREGEGGGEVTSSPAGVSCGETCAATYHAGDEVELFAAPDADSLFAGWTGACSGTGRCVVMMNRDLTVTARFIPRVYRPDAQIRAPGKGFVGQNRYSADGGGQRVWANAPRGSRRTFVVKMVNDGNTADSFRIRAGGDHGPFHVRYLAGASGNTGITGNVIGGTYETNVVQPGASRLIRLVVEPSRKARPGAKWTWRIAVSSGSSPLVRDVVLARVFAVRG